MATNNKDLATSIVELLGGSSNISTALHCVTRLRFNLRDGSLFEKDIYEAIGHSPPQILLGDTVRQTSTVF